MKPSTSDWYYIPLALVVVATVALNELGYGVCSLLLLIPAYWLMTKAIEKPTDKTPLP